MRLSLWRVTSGREPWLGHRSYWALSPAFPNWFLSWMERVGVAPTDPTMYHANVAVPDDEVLDLRDLMKIPPGDPFSSHPELVAFLRGHGKTWVLFHDGPVENHFPPCAVYIGQEAVPALPVN